MIVGKSINWGLISGLINVPYRLSALDLSFRSPEELPVQTSSNPAKVETGLNPAKGETGSNPAKGETGSNLAKGETDSNPAKDHNKRPGENHKLSRESTKEPEQEKRRIKKQQRPIEQLSFEEEHPPTEDQQLSNTDQLLTKSKQHRRSVSCPEIKVDVEDEGKEVEKGNKENEEYINVIQEIMEKNGFDGAGHKEGFVLLLFKYFTITVSC